MVDASVIKLAKSMKREFVELNETRIIGSDVNRGVLSCIYSGSNEYYIGTIAELEGKKAPGYWIPLDRLKRDLIRLESNVYDVISKNNVLFIEKDLKENDMFMMVQGTKATDGATRFISGMNYIMYSFSSLHPVNKPDSISMKIYDYDSISYLAEFAIKKKSHTILEYIRYLYL